MAKDIKEKKEKKEKRSEVDGVKKSKKDKKEKKSADVDTEMLEAELEKAPEVSQVAIVDGEEVEGALVPFAFPLSDDAKEVKKILKTVKKCEFPRMQYHAIPYLFLSTCTLPTPTLLSPSPAKICSMTG